MTLFPEKLALPGMADRATAEMLSRMSGEYDRMSVSVGQPGRSVSPTCWLGPITTANHDAGLTYHTSREAVLSVADITGVPPGRGLHWSTRGWELITLNPW